MLPLLVAALLTTQADVSVINNALLNAQPGGPIQYFINVRNAGPDVATNVVLTDVIPASTTFIAEDHPAGATCSSPAVGGTGAVSCTIPTLQSGGRALFFVEVQVDATVSSGTIISNTANVDSSNDPNSANNSSTATITVLGPLYVSTDLSVTTSGPAAALAGTAINYSVSLVNNGPVDATNVSVVDGIPPYTTFVSGAQTSGPKFTCSAPSPGGRRGMSCMIGTLQNGARATFTVAVRVDPGCPTKVISNAAAITSDTANLIGTRSASASSAITAVPGSSADVSVSILPPRSVPPGGVIRSYIELINTGPADATNVTLTYEVPPETTFLNATYPSVATCATPLAGSEGTVICSIPALLNEVTMIFTTDVQISPGPAAAAIPVAATVASATDPDMTYNSATATVLIDAANLSISDTADRKFVVAGGTIVYTIRVMNDGPASASGVVVDDSLPPGATFVSAKPSQGLCNGTSCSLGAIERGGSATITLTIVAPTVAGQLINSANVRSSTTDPSSKDNESTAAVFVVIPVKR